MKCTDLLVGAVLLTSTALASAADIGVSKTLTLENDGDVFNAGFLHVFNAADKGKSFLDVYTFDIPTAILGASFSSPATFNGNMASSDLSFTSFDLYSSTGMRLATGTFGSGDVFMGWDAGALNAQLAAGTYSLKIGGSVLGAGGGAYYGGVTVSPVPEPETWGMTLSGIAAVGFLARRRRAKEMLRA